MGPIAIIKNPNIYNSSWKANFWRTLIHHVDFYFPPVLKE